MDLQYCVQPCPTPSKEIDEVEQIQWRATRMEHLPFEKRLWAQGLFSRDEMVLAASKHLKGG